jgi:hypothetical protein
MIRRTHSMSVRLCMPDRGQLAHQRRAADDAGEQAGDLEVLAVLRRRAASGSAAGERVASTSASWIDVGGHAAVS